MIARIQIYQDKHPVISGVICGALLGVGFLSTWFVAVSTLALIYMVYQVYRATSPYQLALFGLAVWLAKSAVVLSWGVSLYPIEWLPPLSPVTEFLFIGFYWLVSLVALGLPGILFGVVPRLFSRITTYPRVLFPLVFTGVAFIVEILGATLFSVVWYGSGGGITSAFSFGQVGYLVASWPGFIVLATQGGVYALTISGWLVISYGLLAVLEQSRREQIRNLSIVFMVTVVVLVISTTKVGSPQTQITVAIVDTHFEAGYMPVDTDTHLDTVHTLVTEALTHNPYAVILPEDMRYFVEFYRARESGIEAAFTAYKLINPTTTTKIVDTSAYSHSGVTREWSFILDTSATTVSTSSKSYLVPQGEYMPYLTSSLLRLMGQAEIATGLINYLPYSRSESSTAPDSIAVLFCFESVKPWQARAVVGRDTVFIAHPISHAKFNEPTMFWHQLDTMLRVQAVYAKVPIISAGNMVKGKAYLPDGRIDEGEVVYEKDGNLVSLIHLGETE